MRFGNTPGVGGRGARLASRLLVAGLGACGGASLAEAGPEPPELRASVSAENPSTDGTFELEWGDPGAARDTPRVFHVQIAAPPDADTWLDWYQGPALQSFVSGIPTGDVRVRVRAKDGDGDWGPWSEPTVVPVRHHAMSRALALMAVGFVVFALVTAFVSTMAYRTRASRGGAPRSDPA